MVDSKRTESVVGLVFRTLGSNFVVGNDQRPNMAFQIVERSQTRFDDGKKYRIVGGMSARQLNTIMDTSPDDTEAAQRIINTIFQKPDPGAVANQERSTESLVDAVVERVMEHINKRLTGFVAAAAPPTPPPAAEIPQGVQAKKETNTKKIREQKDNDIALWRERAKLLNVEVKMTKDGKNIDGRWLRTARKLWDEHVAGNT